MAALRVLVHVRVSHVCDEWRTFYMHSNNTCADVIETYCRIIGAEPDVFLLCNSKCRDVLPVSTALSELPAPISLEMHQLIAEGDRKLCDNDLATIAIRLQVASDTEPDICTKYISRAVLYFSKLVSDQELPNVIPMRVPEAIVERVKTSDLHQKQGSLDEACKVLLQHRAHGRWRILEAAVTTIDMMDFDCSTITDDEDNTEGDVSLDHVTLLVNQARRTFERHHARRRWRAIFCTHVFQQLFKASCERINHPDRLTRVFHSGCKV